MNVIISSVCGSSHLPWLCIRPSERVVHRWCHLKSVWIKNLLIMIENDQYWSKLFDNDKKWGQADCLTVQGTTRRSTYNASPSSSRPPTRPRWDTFTSCLRPMLVLHGFSQQTRIFANLWPIDLLLSDLHSQLLATMLQKCIIFFSFKTNFNRINHFSSPRPESARAQADRNMK